MTTTDRAALSGSCLPERLLRLAGPDGKPPPYIRCDDGVPRDDQGEWIDSGYWRDIAGVTHWHLSCQEWRINDTTRFSNEPHRRREARQPRDGVARSPLDVTHWHLATKADLAKRHELTDEMLQRSGIAADEDWLLAEEVIFRSSMFGRDVCTGLAVRNLRIVHINAYAMTAATCSSPH